MCAERHLGCPMLEVMIRPRVIEMPYVGQSDVTDMYLWMYKAVVSAVRIWIILGAHPVCTRLRCLCSDFNKREQSGSR